MASMDMVRVIVSDRLDNHLGDIDPAQVAELTDVAQVNGEHALTIVTTQELEKTNRLLIRDARGYWHEYVVLGIQSERDEGGTLWHEYYCVWSMQYDLSATFIDDMYGCGVVPGHASVPQTARRGLECALEGTSRWAIGAIGVTTMASASFYRRSGWEGLQTVVEKWGGELGATITVDSSGVASRAVDLLAHEGRSEAVRRFDYGHDVTGIKQTVSDDIWPCRIVPLGASQETEAGGYTRRPSIESVNGGVMWLQDDDAVPLTRVPDGEGGWEYPTLIVTNDTYEEPADLKEWALEHITDYTRPIVSYEATVAQFARAGLDAHGVGLGDEVAVVDRTFGRRGLRLKARVLKIKQSLLDPAQTELTIGNLAPSLGGEFASVERQVTALAQTVENGSAYSGSTAWVQNLLARINADINATGGFTYITEGQGIRTYDVAVTDPLVGAEASAVVEVKGGTIRIANTKTAQGQWEWKTIFTSGYVNAEVIRAIGALTGSHVEVTPTGVYLVSSSGVKTIVLPTGLEIDNEAGAKIFEINTAGGEARTRAKDLHTWDTTASVTMSPYTARDSEAADGDTTVTVTVNGTEYTLDATYASVTITPGASVAVNLTQAGVPYVRELMVELDDDGNVIATYPSTLSVEYTLATTLRAKLSFVGDQLVDGVGKAIVAENTVWSSDNKTDVFLVTRNAVTGAGVRFGVGAGGHNRGVYDHVKKDWVIYRNADNKTVINGANFSVAASGATKCGLAGNFTRTSVTILNSQSMAVDGYQQGTTSLTKAGWKPIGIAGWHSNSRFAVTVRAYVSGASNGSGTLNWEVYNVRSSSITATVIIYVLWARV